MRIKRELTRVISSLIAACAISILAMSLAAAATTGPTGKLTFATNRVNSGAPVAFRYHFTNVVPGSTLHVQRQFGTAKVWENIALFKLHTDQDQGQGTFPELPQGSFAYRVFITHNDKWVWYGGKPEVYSYADVSFGVICDGMTGSNCGSGTGQVGSTVFSYVADPLVPARYPQYNQFGSQSHTTCRSGIISFAGDFTSGIAYAEVLRSDADAQVASAAAGTIGALHATFDGGAWILDLSTSQGTDFTGGANSVWVNGVFDCYTPTGL
jgi:hypothetical protein